MKDSCCGGSVAYFVAHLIDIEYRVVSLAGRNRFGYPHFLSTMMRYPATLCFYFRYNGKAMLNILEMSRLRDACKGVNGLQDICVLQYAKAQLLSITEHCTEKRIDEYLLQKTFLSRQTQHTGFLGFH